MNLPINTIFCVGRNYVAHIHELQNEIPTEPLIFIKPNNSLLQNNGVIHLPEFSQNVHYEAELVVQIGANCQAIAPKDAHQLIAGYAVGLDLTARDVQDNAKQKGLPWTKAKGFRGAACVSDFVAADALHGVDNIEFTLKINDLIRQHGQSNHMIYPIGVLLSHLANVYGLRRGDIVFTGTPSGVGQLHSGDVLTLNLHNILTANFTVAS